MTEPSDTPDELRRLLDLAEQIRESRDFVSRRESLIRVSQGALVVIGLIVGPLVGISVEYGSAVVAAILGVTAVYIAMLQVLYARAARRVSEDERALEEVVAIVREVEATASHEQRWSPLERAEFRIRLSRFEP